MAQSRAAAATTTYSYIDENSEDGELAGDDEDIGRPPPAKALRKCHRTPHPYNKSLKREERMSREDDTEDSLDIKPPQAQTVQHGNRQRHREKKEKERQHGGGGGSSASSSRKGEHRVSSKERHSTRARGGYYSGEKRKAPSGESRVESSNKRKEKESLVRRGTSRETRGNEFLSESATDQRDALVKDGGSGMRVIRDARERIRDREKEKEERERVERERVEREKRRDRLIYVDRERERQREHQKRELEKRQLTKKDGEVIILDTSSSHRSRNGSPEKSRSESHKHEEGKKSKDSKYSSSLEMSRNFKEQVEEMESPVSQLDDSEEENEFDDEEQYTQEKSEEEEVNVSEQDIGSEREEHSDTNTMSEEEYYKNEEEQQVEPMEEDQNDLDGQDIVKKFEDDLQSEGEMEEDNDDDTEEEEAYNDDDDRVEEEEEEENEEENDEEEDGKNVKKQNDDQTITCVLDSPPKSPAEMKHELPPYFPAIQGSRRVYEEFQRLNRIEEGTYGVVFRAKHKKTNEIVALKSLKMENEKEGFPITSLREINTLLKAQHPNIVTLREIVVGSDINEIYIVMDYVEHDLKSLMEIMKQPFRIGEVKTLMIQLLRAVAHLHDNWILHRDLKVSNLLLSHKGILKVGDFGLAREYGSPLKNYTSVVVTLWYRAPELLLGAKEYSTPIDIWSVGCIFGELLTMKPLFPGKSEISQITNHIFKQLGTPNDKIWPGYSELPVVKQVNFTNYPYSNIRKKLGKSLSNVGFDLLSSLLTYDPKRRITAEDACKHKYFNETPLPIDPSMFPTWPAKSEQAYPRVAQSPKAPSGGKQFAKQMGEDADVTISGFHMGAPDVARGDMFWIRY